MRGRCTGAKRNTEATACDRKIAGVGEHSVLGQSMTARTCELYRSDHADISNDKTGEKPVRRKPKVSRARVIRPGLVGT